MEKAISAAEANRNFSKLLRNVREGRSFLVTSHGKPVARLIPPETNGRVSRAARATLFKRLRAEPVKDIGRWRREELYEDEP